ncbi:hypothetical protein QFW77_14630 [Luteimonas sp. RD2P54]|uniref:Uncharacterized protein n=1 Tax=Luteimonas endophytica TaxID=3042023 RepID=A0ABT6JBL6_9GAMM|nr:hypothetical protein [Luteimonas endophytica]MDH5824214.1 hypothetical protein [Luteimonas endophytica]
MNRSTISLACATAIQVFVVGAANAGPQEEPMSVPFTVLRVQEFKEYSEVELVGVEGTAFEQAVQATCTSARPPAAPLVTALGGVVVNWLFSRVSSGISKRLKKRIEEHTASYSTPPIYHPVRSSNVGNSQQITPGSGEEPGMFPQTCVVMQRIECKSYVDKIGRPHAECIPGTEEDGFTAAIVMRDESTHLRVLPVATHLGQRKARHHSGDYVVSTTFRIQAISYQDGEGSLWLSPETKAFSHVCMIERNAPTDANCSMNFPITNTQWAEASVLPMPPRTVRALVFSVGEVGEPSRGLKGFAEFMESSGSDMSEALSEAFQLKIGLKDDE